MAALLLALSASTADAQCPDGVWIIDKEIEQFSVDNINDSLFLDPDGPGPQPQELIVAANCLVSGQLTARVLARGTFGWAQMGSEKPGTVRRLYSTDSGLYAIWVDPAATFSSVLRWNGTDWSSLDGVPGSSSADHQIVCMRERSDTPYVGGNFSVIGGVTAGGFALWDGFVWKPILEPNAPTWSVLAIETFGGDMIAVAHADPSTKIHRTGQGSSWQSPFGEVKADIREVVEYSGSLFAGGNNSPFVPPDGTQYKAQGLAFWDGLYWDEVAGFKGGTVRELEADAGELLVGGKFLHVPSINGTDNASVLVWDGNNWRNPLPKLQPDTADIYTISVVGDGSFVVGGNGIRLAGTPPTELWHVATWIPAQCFADCDCDKVLVIDDFICFQTFFALGDPYADCDLDGGLTIDDFICFQTYFAIGC